MSPEPTDKKLEETEEEKFERLREKLVEAVLDVNNPTINPVKDVIPGINIDGLLAKGTNARVPFCDSNEDFNDSHMPTELEAAFANSLYGLGYDAKVNPEKFLEITKALELFKNQIVVDLGAGGYLPGYYIADRADAKAYVAVEPNFTRNLVERLVMVRNKELFGEDGLVKLEEGYGNTYRLHELKNNLKVAVVKEDMLTFLRRLPDNSVSILCSGIDEIVLPNQTYRKKVAREIIRTLNPLGAYIGSVYGGFIDLPKSDDISVEGIDIGNTAIEVFKKNKK